MAWRQDRTTLEGDHYQRVRYLKEMARQDPRKIDLRSSGAGSVPYWCLVGWGLATWETDRASKLWSRLVII